MSKVPKKIAAKAIFLSDRRCCVCKKPGQHLHHLDGNQTNHNEGNLALLCFSCHDEATRTRGLTRKLSRETISLYKDEWYEKVRKNRGISPLAGSTDDAGSKLTQADIINYVLEAQQIHEVRKIRYELSGLEWDTKLPLINKLGPYGEESSIRVRKEIIYALEHISGKTRFKMPQEIATAISSVTCSSLPIWHLLHPVGKAVPAEEQSLLEQASHIGLCLAYDGAKYLKNLKVVDAGGNILWEILRYAQLNKLLGPKERALDGFKTAMDGAGHNRDNPFNDAVRWLTFLRDDALAIDDDRLPDYPSDLAQMILGI